MSDRTKIQAVEAMKVADEIVARLRPCCDRICVAGSLRRQKPEVGDIEILYIPKMTERSDGLFDRRIVSVASEVIDNLLRDGYFTKRASKTGIFSWGEANKLAIHTASGIPVDLFATDAPRWWVALVIRTGSKETNLKLTTGAQKKGATLNAYGSGLTWSDGTKTDATSERHLFELCGVPYKEPQNR